MAPPKKIFLFVSLLLASIILLSADFAFAQRALEVPLPQIGEATISETPLLPDYVKYVFNFSVGIAGLVAFLSLIYGGFRHLTSVGNPAAMADANDQIFSGIIGLIVILGSWLLLTTINPQLVVLTLGREATPEAAAATGVFLCKTGSGDMAEDCEGPLYSDKSGMSSGFNDATNYVRFKNEEGSVYGVILHEDDYFRGKCEIVLSSGGGDELVSMSKLGGEVSSVTLFKVGDSSGGGVTIYECKNFECDIEKYSCDRDCSTGDGRVWGPFTLLVDGNFKNNSSITPHPKGAGFRSVEIDGRYLALFSTGTGFGGQCEVFTISDSDVASNDIGECGGGSNLGCFESVYVLPIK